MLGSLDQLEETFRVELDGLYRYAVRLLGDPGEAEDAVHDTFLRSMRRGTRPGEIVSLKAWLFRVLRNLCLDRLRARARRRMVIVDTEVAELRAQSGGECTPEAALIASDSLSRVEAAMAALPPEQAETLSLIVVEGLSYAETAWATDVPIGTVRSRLSSARRSLRGALEARNLSQEDETTPTLRVVSQRIRK